MKRTIIKIDEDKCDGCGVCVTACHEGALAIIDGKAKLVREDYCDGIGNCLPVCPTGAISFEEKEIDECCGAEDAENAACHGAEEAETAACYGTENAENAACHGAEDAETAVQDDLPCGCPGTHVKTFDREAPQPPTHGTPAHHATHQPASSQLKQWPIQIKLVPVNAPYFKGAKLLVAADCAAYAYGNFHNDYMRDKITLIGCPKLDDCDYTDKLTAILKANDIKSVTVARMVVPCCGGIESAVKNALQNSGKMIPWQVVVIDTDGNIEEAY